MEGESSARDPSKDSRGTGCAWRGLARVLPASQVPRLALSLGTPSHSILALGYSQTLPLSGAGGLCILDLTGDLYTADPVGPCSGR